MIPSDIKDWLSYDPGTGVFRWLKRPSQNRRAGAVAGSLNSKGYRQIYFRSRSYKAHRLAFWWVHGWLPKEIDHRDGVRANNRIANLRAVTRSQNGGNSRPNKGRRWKGVYWSKRNQKWRAHITTDGVRRSLGYHSTEEAAACAYDDAAREHFGEFARLNFPDMEIAA